ncbi:tubulin alpha chain-like [Topomyia yanbarensis]|uniref:tubulin alpha chain-like n=1 Tax=Topomyia yanbarensis TaxID=2498891 RepID=UPI00273AC61D|nr:tubulin alpha chain-like [Topomyia yanbarensis]
MMGPVFVGRSFRKRPPIDTFNERFWSTRNRRLWISINRFGPYVTTIRTGHSVDFPQIGINQKCPAMIPDGDLASIHRGVSMLASNTAISEAWQKLNYKFDLMYRKKAFVHCSGVAKGGFWGLKPPPNQNI